jgi:hypothetical protein
MGNQVAAIGRRDAFLDGCDLPFLYSEELLDCFSG